MRKTVGAVLLAGAIACGGSGDAGTGPPPPPKVDSTKPTAISIIGLPPASALINTPIPITVRVLNVVGLGVPGISVHVSATAGSVSESDPLSDVAGAARTIWNVGSIAGQQTFTASVSGTALTAQLIVTVAAPPAANITIVGAPNLISYVNHPGSLTVLATTLDGTPAPNTPVTFAASAGALSATTANTGPEGRASTTYTSPGAIGKPTVTASIANGAKTTFQIYVTSSLIASFSASFPSGLTFLPNSDVTPLPVVTVVDATQAPVAGAPVTFSQGSGSVEVLTDAAGKASPPSWRLGSSLGSQTMTASVATLGSVAFSVTSVNSGTLVIGSAPQIPQGTSIYGSIAGPAGFVTRTFSVLQPGTQTISGIPFGTYTVRWESTFSSLPFLFWDPSPVQQTYTLSPSKLVDTVRTGWNGHP